MDTIEELMPYARHVVNGPSMNRALSSGFGVKPGEKVLIAVDTFHDRLVVDALAQAIREVGARCDVFIADAGPDREMVQTDEFRAFMGNTRYGKHPDEPAPWFAKIDAFVEAQGYDLMVRGIGGQTKQGMPYRHEGIPWISREILASGAATFPADLWDLAEAKSWGTIWKHGRGARVRVTDPEGTDFSFTLLPRNYDNADESNMNAFNSIPFHGHFHGHPPPPFDENEDAEGVVAGCLNHWGLPYPAIKVYVERGQVVAIEGGGKYGDAWRELWEATKDIKYPDYPRTGLYWLWEIAIATQPKYRRPFNVTKRSRAMIVERIRSGIIHIGFGTRIGAYSEKWAREQGVPYGHCHVHLLFPTYELTSVTGEKFKVTDGGHLTALDDPEVIELAAKYGDPKEVLKEEWIPPIPGISIPGDYWKEYAGDPAGWIRRREQAGLPI